MGLGLVRSVDVATGTLFILTPALPARLARVTALARSTLEVPLALLQPTCLTSASPFLADGALRAGTGGQRMRSRNNLLRGPPMRA